jgi:hypothetical protein
MHTAGSRWHRQPGRHQETGIGGNRNRTGNRKGNRNRKQETGNRKQITNSLRIAIAGGTRSRKAHGPETPRSEAEAEGEGEGEGEGTMNNPTPTLSAGCVLGWVVQAHSTIGGSTKTPGGGRRAADADGRRQKADDRR